MGQVLHQGRLEIEPQQAGPVGVRPQHLLEELAAGGLLLLDEPALAPAGVDEQAQGERQGVAAGEVRDLLRAAVFLEDEVIGGEAGDRPAVLVFHAGQDVDDPDVLLDDSPGILLRTGDRRGRQHHPEDHE